MTFGENLQNLLDEREITQKEFASMLNIAKTTMNGYIKNNHQPNIETIKAMATTLNISTDELLGHEMPDTLSHKEQLLIQRLRRLTVKERNLIFNLVALADKHSSL